MLHAGVLMTYHIQGHLEPKNYRGYTRQKWTQLGKKKTQKGQERGRKGHLTYPHMQELFDLVWPWVHTGVKAPEFSFCSPWAASTLSPARVGQIPSANGHWAGLVCCAKLHHFCNVCKHFCLCGCATKDKSISRSFLLSSVGEESRIPKNVKHSASTINCKRSSLF